MKTNSIYSKRYAALALVLMLAACADIAGPGPKTGSGEAIPPGMGLARIRLAFEGPAQSVRTAVPNIGNLYFTLDFTAPGKTVVNKTLSSDLTLVLALEPAAWNLEVRGYADSTKTVLKAAGSASFSVAGGMDESFNVYLAPYYSSGATGSLSYSITLPDSVSRAWLGLYPIDDTPGTSEEIDISSSADRTGTVNSLSAGSYRAVIDLYDGTNNQAATWTGAAHIYGDSTTFLTHTFTVADLAACPPPPTVTPTANTLAAKLNAALASPSGFYTIVLDGTETDLASFAPKTLNVTGGNDISITIRGNGKTVQVANSTGSLFTLAATSGSSLTLAIQGLTLKGRGSNSIPVVRVNARATLLMKAGSLITGNNNISSSSYGGGVFVNGGTFSMSGGVVSDNGASSLGGGGVYVYNNGTFNMSGGNVSGNTTTTANLASSNLSSSGGGVHINGGSFTMSGGAVSGNTVSGTAGYAKEALIAGTFSISGDARPERVFLYGNTRFITIIGPLSGGLVPIDLWVSSSVSEWVNKPILKLDSSYGAGNLAALKTHFVLGNSKRTNSPYTETPITGYEIDNSGLFVTVSP